MTVKMYFIDNGIRNTLIENYQTLNLRADSGALIENFAFSQLYKTKPETDSLHFWRTRNKNEIDFVLNRQCTLYPFETKTPGSNQSFQNWTSPKF